MAFVKLDCGMLDSTIWLDPDACRLFIAALLMARPKQLLEMAPQIEVRTLNLTGFEVPPGWYGFVAASGIGIINRARMDAEIGLAALERLGSPELDSRTPDFEGRRLIRVSGGFIALNYSAYREKDHTAALRAKRYRQKAKKTSKQVRAESESREKRAVKAFENGDIAEADRIAVEGLPEECR